MEAGQRPRETEKSSRVVARAILPGGAAGQLHNAIHVVPGKALRERPLEQRLLEHVHFLHLYY